MRAQLRVALGLVGDAGDDAHAHAELDVGLDHVGVHRGQHDVGREAALVEGLSMRVRPVKPVS